jgi:hypothetical protein
VPLSGGLWEQQIVQAVAQFDELGSAGVELPELAGEVVDAAAAAAAVMPTSA